MVESYPHNELAYYESSVHLAELNQPIDPGDRPWMELLGCEWPTSESEAVWLKHANNLYEIGGDQSANHGTAYASIGLQARREFLGLMPRACSFIKNHPEIDFDLPSTRKFVGVRRMLYDLGVDVAVADSKTPLLASADMLIARFALLEDYGVRIIDMIRDDPWYLNLTNRTSQKIAGRMRILRSFARAAGNTPEEATMVAAEYVNTLPSVLLQSHHSLRTLGRVAQRVLEYDDSTGLKDNAVSIVRDGLTRVVVAAKLSEQRSLPLTARRLHTTARRLGDIEYSETDLRQYLAGYTDDTLVRSYFRARPLSKKERDGFAHPGKLPEVEIWVNTEPEPRDAYNTRSMAPSSEQFRERISRLPEVEEHQVPRLLDAVAAGLIVEESTIDPFLYTDEQAKAVTEGRDARRRLIAAYAARTMALPQNSEHDQNSDTLQADFLRLTIAVVELARRHHHHPEDSPPQAWNFLEEYIVYLRRYTLNKLPFFDDPEPDSEPDSEPVTIHLPDRSQGESIASSETPSAEAYEALRRRFGGGSKR